MEPAVGLLEFSSIARGIEAGDAMVKSAPLEVIRAGTVHPGKYLVLVGGLTNRLADRFADRLRPADTYLSQVLEFLLVLRELEASRDLSMWPWPVAEWPIPTERAFVRAMDALCPAGRVALLGVFGLAAVRREAPRRRSAA